MLLTNIKENHINFIIEDWCSHVQTKVYPSGNTIRQKGLIPHLGLMCFGPKSIVPTIGVKQLEGASIKFINLGFEKNIIGK